MHLFSQMKGFLLNIAFGLLSFAAAESYERLIAAWYKGLRLSRAQDAACGSIRIAQKSPSEVFIGVESRTERCKGIHRRRRNRERLPSQRMKVNFLNL